MRLSSLALLLALAACDDWRDDLAAWNVDKPLPEFPLLDQHGRSVSLARGPTFIAFAFSRCAVPTACPQTLARLRQIEGPVRTVVVTLDPEHDTPDVLKEWAERSKLARTTFATGERETIDALASCFNVFITKDMAHPVKAALLIDGRVVRTWTENAFTREDVARAIAGAGPAQQGLRGQDPA